MLFCIPMAGIWGNVLGEHRKLATVNRDLNKEPCCATTRGVGSRALVKCFIIPGPICLVLESLIYIEFKIDPQNKISLGTNC